MNVTAEITLVCTRCVHRDVMVESHELKPGVYVGRTWDLKVCMADTTNKTQSCFSAIVVSDETPVSADSDGTPVVADDTLVTVFEKLPGEVTADQRRRVADLLSEYDDLFSRGIFGTGRLIRVFRTVIINLVFFLGILTLYCVTVGCEAPVMRTAHRRGVPGTFLFAVLLCKCNSNCNVAL